MEDLKNENKDITNERLWSLLCYIPVLGVVTCLVGAVRMVGSKLCRFHVRQGLVVFGLFVVAIFIGLILPFFSVILNLGALAASGYGMYVGYHGKMDKIVVLGDFAMKIEEFELYRKLTGSEPDKNLLK